MGLPVGDILDFLDGWERSDRVVVNVPGPELFLYVESEQLHIGSGQGNAEKDGLVVVSWDRSEGVTESAVQSAFRVACWRLGASRDVRKPHD